MNSATAWLLDLDGTLRAAVGEQEMTHFIPAPELHPVPLSPVYCNEVLIWQDNIVPVLDLAAWLHDSPVNRRQSVVGIIVYQESPGAPTHFGALHLANVPNRVQVTDEQSCDLPEQPVRWQEVAISCFADAQGAVPILDLGYIFSNALLATTQSTSLA